MKLLILLAFCGALAHTQDVPEQESVKFDTVAGGEETEAWHTHAESSYHFYSIPLNWPQAHMTCVGAGGHLVVINDQAEEDRVRGMSKGQPTWIGLSDAQQFGLWFWINSDPLSFTNWCPGEPEDRSGSQKCVLTNHPGYANSSKLCWDGQECEKTLPFVCERKDSS